jgi:PAC2 family
VPDTSPDSAGDIPLRNPILVAAFEGWNDAADAATDAVRFLLRSLRATEVFELEAQEYSDFQSARPLVTLANGVVTEIHWRTTNISVARLSGAERDLILVLGVEPNLKWRQFCDEILSYAEIHSATTIVTLGALLGDAPHTRTLPITGTASDPATIAKLGLQRSRYEGPTGIVGVLADAARRSGFEAISLWVPVPHYTAAAPNPKATLTLLQHLATLFALPLELSSLAVAARGWQVSVDTMVETDGDLTAYVHQLEARFDSDEDLSDDTISIGIETESLFDSEYFNEFDELFEDDDDEDDDDDDDEFDEDDLPSGDSLAQDFERYLRDQRPNEEPS